MTEAMRPYLRDRKLDVPLRNKDDSVALILEWFLHGINEVEVPDRIAGQLEDAQYNRELYEKLGWQEERHFDVVSSFWSVFACAVIVEVHENVYPCSSRYYTFPDYVEYPTPRISGGKSGSGKGKYRNPSFEEKYFSNEYPAIRKVVDGTVAAYPKLKELAALTHSVANFSPCPAYPFNREKGISQRVHDFLPLFADFIEADGTPAAPERGQSWKNWLIRNRERLFLESYYEVYTASDGSEHIRGIPFFDGQSLTHPLPQTKEKVTACLDEMVRRIYDRAEKMSDFASLKR